MRRGIANALLGRHEAAEMDYSKSMEYGNNNTTIYRNRGLAREAIGKHHEAICDFSEALARDDSDLSIYLRRGNLLFILKRYDEAIEDFDVVIKRDRKCQDALCFRGNAYGAKGDYAQAYADQSMAIELEANYAGAYSNRGLTSYLMGNKLSALEDWKAARKLGDVDAQDYLDKYFPSHEQTSEGGQQLVDKIRKFSIDLAQQPNVFAVISYNEGIDYEILGEFTIEADAKSFFEKNKISPPSGSKSLEICIMNNGYFVLDEDVDEGVIERFEIPGDL